MSDRQSRPVSSRPQTGAYARSGAQRGGASYARRPNAGYAPRRPSGPRRSASPLTKALKTLGKTLLVLVGAIAALLSWVYHRFDRFRRDAVSAVITNALLGGAVICVILAILLACKPSIDMRRARSNAAKGNVASATRLLRTLESGGLNETELESTRLSVAEGFIRAGEYDAADNVLSELSDSERSAELLRESRYGRAGTLYAEGDYADAASIYYQLDDYRDSASLYADCRCALAIQAWQSGSESSAHSLLLDVPDVAQRVEKAAYSVAQDEAEAQRILSAEIFQPDALNRLEQTMANLTQARSDLPNGRIAAGGHHTLGLTGQGLVLAAGDDSFGQCQVSTWSNISQVAAGAFHSVGLRADGTVLAIGDNSQNQCDTADWTDVVSIAAAAYDTIGLKSDGSVVACGMHASLVTGWRNATQVAAGGYSMACLYDKGEMLSSHSGAQMDMGVVLYDLSVCNSVSAGVLYDGTLVSTFDGAPDWEGMVTVTVCETGLLGVDVDGRVRVKLYRDADTTYLDVPGTAVEVESSGAHHVVLTEDGRVYGFGNDDSGQCQLSNWQL